MGDRESLLIGTAVTAPLYCPPCGSSGQGRNWCLYRRAQPTSLRDTPPNPPPIWKPGQLKPTEGRPLAWMGHSSHSPRSSATPGSGMATHGSSSGSCLASGWKGCYRVLHRAATGTAVAACGATAALQGGSENAAWLLQSQAGPGPRSPAHARAGRLGQGEAAGVKPELGGTSPSWVGGAVEAGAPFFWLGMVVTLVMSPPPWPTGLLATPSQRHQQAQRRGGSPNRPFHARGVCEPRWAPLPSPSSP